MQDVTAGRRNACFTLTAMSILALVILPAAMLALEPPTPEQIEQYQRDGSWESRVAAARELGNHKMAPGLIERAQYTIRRLQLKAAGMSDREIDEIMAPPPARLGMPTKGTVRIVALLIAFEDYPPSNSLEFMESKLFGSGETGMPFPYESLHNYYDRSSYGQLDIQGDILGWYTTPYPRNQVVRTRPGREALIAEALTHYDDAGHDFSQYDNDGDGTIDYLVVVWTGPHDGWSEFWWGYMTSYTNSEVVLDGKVLDTYSWQWEAYNYPNQFSPTTVIHETGHALGLPDYYDYDDNIGPRGGVGGLDMMDATRGDHNCFSKFMLEWITPAVVNAAAPGSVLPPSGLQPEAIILMPEMTPGKTFGEYFMIQNRWRTANDSLNTADGLLIWHVDARLNDSGTNFRYDNSYTEHKLLRLVEADASGQIELGYPANAMDYFQENDEFGNEEPPRSDRYDGTPTGKAVRHIDMDETTRLIAFDIEDDYQDTTPPVGIPATPWAMDGPVIRLPMITFAWDGGTCADAESGIIGYELEVAELETKAVIYFDFIGFVTEKTFMSIQNGYGYQARVRAVNGSGMRSDWTPFSDPAFIDLPPLSQALDNYTLDWFVGGDSPWYGQEDVHYYMGPSAAQSGIIGDMSHTYFGSWVTGPGILSFYWRVSSEFNWDFLHFMVDEETVLSLSGQRNWERRIVEIGEGVHSLVWVYVKDQAVSSGLDAGWVDHVAYFMPAPGDLNYSGDLDASDLTILTNFRVGNLVSGPEPFVAPQELADVDGSGDVDAVDQVILAAALAEKVM
jgi:M6 family metalloprotease-like protein